MHKFEIFSFHERKQPQNGSPFSEIEDYISLENSSFSFGSNFVFHISHVNTKLHLLKMCTKIKWHIGCGYVIDIYANIQCLSDVRVFL